MAEVVREPGRKLGMRFYIDRVAKDFLGLKRFEEHPSFFLNPDVAPLTGHVSGELVHALRRDDFVLVPDYAKLRVAVVGTVPSVNINVLRVHDDLVEGKRVLFDIDGLQVRRLLGEWKSLSDMCLSVVQARF